MVTGKKILSGLALAGAGFGGATIITTGDSEPPVITEQAQVIVLDEQVGDDEVEQGEASEKTQVKVEAEVDENTLEGEEFFDTYISGEGSVVVSEGIAYKALAYSSEESVADDADQVRIIGKKIDGTVFEDPGDQARLRSESQDLVPGITKVLETMKPGDKREIVIAPGQAYGSKGLKGKVEPNETLIYEVEIISADEVRKQEGEGAAQKEKEEADRIAEKERIAQEEAQREKEAQETKDAQAEKDRQAKERKDKEVAEAERQRKEREASVSQEPVWQPPTYSCNCSKTCSNMSSCDEAYYQLNNCGCSVRDGDDDGIPCENIC